MRIRRINVGKIGVKRPKTPPAQPYLDPVRRTAIISRDGRYRYRLARVWDDDKPPMVWIMLNPSTADHETDDPTIRKCMKFARREGCGSIIVVNVYAYRATKPVDMLKAKDPIGPENQTHILNALVEAKSRDGIVVAAWGAHAVHAGALRLPDGAFCLGHTNNGSPRHPLYVRDDAKLVSFGGMPDLVRLEDGYPDDEILRSVGLHSTKLNR